MLRLKTDALEIHEKEFYYERMLFTGIAFKTDKGRVTDAFYVLNGVRQGDYAGDYVKVTPGSMRLETDCEGLQGEREYDQVTSLNGVPYDGMLYEFEYNFCISETAFEKGLAKPVSVEWHRNGVLRCYDNFGNGVGDAFEWYDTGQLKSIYTVKVIHVRLSADFSRDGQLKHLSISDKFFETPRSVPNDSPFATINDIEDFDHFNIPRRFSRVSFFVDRDLINKDHEP
jgi:hypothetical protein